MFTAGCCSFRSNSSSFHLFIELSCSTTTAGLAMGRRPLDKNAPRKPASSFMLYMQHRRQTCPEQFASLTFGERSQVLGAEWTQLSAEAKEPYLMEANRQRDDYKALMVEYQKSDNYRAWISAQQQRPDTANKAPSSKWKRCDTEKPATAGRKRLNTTGTRWLTPAAATNTEHQISIFTQEFLECNRIREVASRQLKKRVSHSPPFLIILRSITGGSVGGRDGSFEQIRGHPHKCRGSREKSDRFCHAITQRRRPTGQAIV